MMFRYHMPPSDFKLALCPSCGFIMDFTFGQRTCMDCGRKVCRNCRDLHSSPTAKSRCNKCGKKSRIPGTKSSETRP